MIGEPGHEIGSALGPERHDEIVPIQRLRVGGHATSGRIDRRDVTLQKPNAPLIEQRTGATSLLERREAGDRPELAQSGQEVFLAIDHHDLVASSHQLAQFGGQRETAKAGAKNENSHGGNSPRVQVLAR